VINFIALRVGEIKGNLDHIIQKKFLSFIKIQNNVIMIEKSIVKMKPGQLIIVLHVPVDSDWPIVLQYNVQFIHIVVICINQKMNVVPNVEVNQYLKKIENFLFLKNRLFK
jgi:hypothetical protein